MSAPGSVVDGSPGYGCIIITLSRTGNVILENVDPVRPVTEAHDRKVNGEPGRSRYVQDFASFTCTMQAASGTSGIPGFGETATFTMDADNYGVEVWILMPVPTPLSNDPSALRKWPATFKKKNCLTVTEVAALPPSN